MSAHDDFAAALLDPQHPCPPDLTCWNGSAVEARFAVYRNNVFSSLVGALADSFPVVQQLVGEAFFGAMARVYVHRSPPRSPLLLHYGDDFPTFIEGFEPAGSLPYLADVARLERLRSRAYHAADSPSLDADAIARVLAAPDQLPGIRFQLH
ncbi:DUF2063 domain-containing protein, partial [Pseudomonas sp. CrR25]|nr:DUF2063 domain-containing protein [Pseudomonas sp. CrR25]